MEARRSKLTLVANVALALEYEAICRTTDHRLAAGMSQKRVGIFLDAVLALAEPVETHFMWRPQLRDPADEFVLEAAVNGGANTIVTFNKRDFVRVADTFGIEVLSPVEMLRRIKP